VIRVLLDEVWCYVLGMSMSKSGWEEMSFNLLRSHSEPVNMNSNKRQTMVSCNDIIQTRDRKN
jgi:hypothetical protein